MKMASSRLRALMGMSENDENGNSRIKELHKEGNKEKYEAQQMQERKQRIREKIKKIKNSDSALKDKILEYEAKLEQCNVERKQVKLRLDTINEAKKQVIQIHKRMNDALSCGQIDMMGGGIAVSFLKHRVLDEVQELIVNLRKTLETLGEWADCIEGYKELKVNMDAHSRACDGFLDTLGIDYSIQREMRNSGKKIDKLKMDIVDAYGKALKEQIEITKRVEAIENEMEKLVME